MPITTYDDRSSMVSDMEAGFQFAFTCNHCKSQWVSEYKPYRLGRLTGLLNRFVFLLGGEANNVARLGESFSDVNMRKAHDEALAAAQVEADRRFKLCHQCGNVACTSCYSDADDCCVDCRSAARGGGAGAAAGGAAATQCPNCQSPTAGGRFCPECGFDMASTHKSCPGCGVMVARQARFCTDCGHAF